MILIALVGACLVCLPFMILQPLQLTVRQCLLLLAVGIFGCMGQFSVTAAYRYAPASEISIFDYTQIVFAAIWGWLVFGQSADFLNYIGYGIILLAAVVFFWKDAKNNDERFSAKSRIFRFHTEDAHAIGEGRQV